MTTSQAVGYFKTIFNFSRPQSKRNDVRPRRQNAIDSVSSTGHSNRSSSPPPPPPPPPRRRLGVSPIAGANATRGRENNDRAPPVNQGGEGERGSGGSGGTASNREGQGVGSDGFSQVRRV